MFFNKIKLNRPRRFNSFPTSPRLPRALWYNQTRLFFLRKAGGAVRERTIQLDETDWRIIRALRENARATFTEIGRAVGLTSPAARERVRRMEEAGLIEGYRPVFNYSVMGFGIKAIILMKSKSDSRVAEKHYFRLLPAVRELEGIVRAWT